MKMDIRKTATMSKSFHSKNYFSGLDEYEKNLRKAIAWPKVKGYYLLPLLLDCMTFVSQK